VTDDRSDERANSEGPSHNLRLFGAHFESGPMAQMDINQQATELMEQALSAADKPTKQSLIRRAAALYDQAQNEGQITMSDAFRGKQDLVDRYLAATLNRGHN
jgi:hypothetical protein